ncbi:MAG: glycosyltransferase family 4 protein [Elusimicrobia bacterium]|nr:glycosyltransferase family 4 protein [Candidatus Liberimonas magnetica]
MKKLLVISPKIPRPDSGAGEYRVDQLCRKYSKWLNVFLLPLQFEWDSVNYINSLKKENINLIFPGHKGIYDFQGLINKYKFEYALFEWFYTLMPFNNYLSCFKKIIVDTHELYYKKLEKKSKVLANERIELAPIRSNELEIYSKADTLITLTREESVELARIFPNKKIITIPIWMDKHKEFEYLPFKNRRDIAYLGLMSRDVNLDAVGYFIDEIFPMVKIGVPDIKFHLAGVNSSIFKNIEKYKKRKDIVIDGEVEDICSYLNKFRVFVCPMRFGAGQKKKILDAVVSGCPVVTSSVGLEGYSLTDGKEILLSDTKKDFAAKVIYLYKNENIWNNISQNALKKVMKLNLYNNNEMYYEKLLKKTVF